MNKDEKYNELKKEKLEEELRIWKEEISLAIAIDEAREKNFHHHDD